MRDKRANCLWGKKKTVVKAILGFCHNLPDCQSGSVKFRIPVKHVLTCCKFFSPSELLAFAFYAFVCPLVFPSPPPICSWHQRPSLISTLSYLPTICCVHLEELTRTFPLQTCTHRSKKKKKKKEESFLVNIPARLRPRWNPSALLQKSPS